MTNDGQRVAGEATPETTGRPVSVGWTQAAIAISSVMALNTPVNLKMVIESHDPLLIDFRQHAFSWSTPIEEFPVDAVHIGLETEPTSADAPPYCEQPGQDLDGLLWEIGISSFGGAVAFWLAPDERYRLTRWPNLTQHSHNMRQVKMIAVLGNAYASVSELAAFAGVEESEAQRLVNALSLMRILSRSSVAPAAPVIAQTPAEKRNSLFGRLLKRLGR